ncbi:hypothetical protein B2J93_5512 [Marssonina coronariae]|uniref:Uncharacterized protein n=1 Tax=Diplocarpon coronariae TaxID=2795749 RepID=A0A218Z0F4_9HELO|nr:hypothetical protein B2J93_5512 [Marssonina coronariae]
MADASSVAYTSDSRNLQSCQLSTHRTQVEGARPTLLSRQSRQRSSAAESGPGRDRPDLKRARDGRSGPSRMDSTAHSTARKAKEVAQRPPRDPRAGGSSWDDGLSSTESPSSPGAQPLRPQTSHISDVKGTRRRRRAHTSCQPLPTVEWAPEP